LSDKKNLCSQLERAFELTDAPVKSNTSLDTLSVNTMRFLAVDAVQKADSGHPGLPLGASPMAYALWTRHLRHNPRNPKWPNRDRFVLSAGHGSMLLYALLYLTGYDLSLDDLKNFRQWDSPTAGHPEYHWAAGVETTTGPLGQGFANGVGMAMAEAFLAATFNKPNQEIVDHYTYVLAGDGDLMEGVASEAASLAGRLQLGKLIVLYDDNKITLSAPAEQSFTEDVSKRFEAYGWQALKVADGNDVEAVSKALDEAKAEKNRPTLISVRTIIGFGSPHKAGSFEAHGSPLGVEEVKLTKQALGWPDNEFFYVPGEALEHFREAVDAGAKAESEWQNLYNQWAAQNPDLAAQWVAAHSGKLPDGWDKDLPVYPADAKAIATRDANGAALNAIAKHIPTFIGGDADLASSTKTTIKDGGSFLPGSYNGRNLHYGVREHGMGSITNGLAVHGGIVKPFTATFLAFADYMRPPIRLASIMGISPIFIFTHDGIGVGEDGPTHQPIEQVDSLRIIPQLTTFRPADPNETVAAWKIAMEIDGPTALIFTRQKVPTLAPEGVMEGVARGAYIKAEADGGKPDVILLGTGSELSLALKAREQLATVGIKARVVSMPSWELFEKQSQDYQNSVLPPEVTARVSIEAGSPFGWHRWVGPKGRVVGLNRFGASAPAEVIYEKLGITAEAVVNAAREILGK
jgi:transketolase